MIRLLCGHLDPRRLYVTVAQAIQQETDLAFAQQLVQTFSWILLTAVETRCLREELLHEHSRHPELLKLAGASPGEDASEPSPSTPNHSTPLFLALLEPWFHNPVSALALCLWSQQYVLASELTARFATFEPTLDQLQQLDQLVRLLESPIFSRLRLRLLEPRRHPALLKCLLALAMILPQASAFSILRERIQVVHSGLLLEAQSEEGRPEASKSTANTWWSGGGLKSDDKLKGSKESPEQARQVDLASLLGVFDQVTAEYQS